MDSPQQVSRKIRSKPEWLISLWLVASGVFGLISIYELMNKYSFLALVPALIIQPLKLITGLSVWFGRTEAKYLLLFVLAWQLVATSMDFISHPIWNESAYTLAYVVATFICYLSATIYLFMLPRSSAANESIM